MFLKSSLKASTGFGTDDNPEKTQKIKRFNIDIPLKIKKRIQVSSTESCFPGAERLSFFHKSMHRVYGRSIRPYIVS